MTLQFKILFSYLILLVVVGSMLLILLYEQRQLRSIEDEYQDIKQTRNNIHFAHHCITELATMGELVVSWNQEDYQCYNKRRLFADSVLQMLQLDYGALLHTEYIDSLRGLLVDKEYHLYNIMQAFKGQKKADSLLLYRLPIVAKQITRSHEITRRKKGIVGFFGGKETIRVIPSADQLHSLNDQLITIQGKRMQDVSTAIDSLRFQNAILNQRLFALIARLDELAQSSFEDKEQKMAATWKLSHTLTIIIFIVAVALLLISYLIIRHDIISREMIREKLQKTVEENEGLLRMRKNIILTVSHDIRGPLGNIVNSAELAMETRGKKRRNDYLNNILLLSRRILHLVSDLMDVYKINEARNTLNEVPFRLSELIGRVSDCYKSTANINGLLFESECRNVDVVVKGDMDKIEQVLDNLLINAIKFTPSGSIRFWSEYADGILHFEISDTGIGMDPATLERIFRPFERAEKNVSSEGFGLGLYIANELVGALGGNMSVKSELKKGSIFTLTFPLLQTDDEIIQQEIKRTRTIILPKKILIVDDDPFLLRISREILTNHGISCSTYSEVKGLVTEFRQSDYDLVLTDIQMPDTDGFGVLRLLRNSNIGNACTVPVAAMTARGDGDSDIYIQAGFCGCLYKPFSTEELLTFVSDMAWKGNCTVTPLFDYSRLMEDISDRLDVLEALKQESLKNIEELGTALRTVNCEAMRGTIHRMLPAWELLGADLELQKYHELLHARSIDKDRIIEHTGQVISWIKELVVETEKKIAYEKENIGCRG